MCSSGYQEVSWRKDLSSCLVTGSESHTDYLIQTTTEIILIVATNHPCQVKHGTHINSHGFLAFSFLVSRWID